MSDLCQKIRGWKRMKPEIASKNGHVKCGFCELNYNYAVENKKDVIVDLLSGDIIGVCIA